MRRLRLLLAGSISLATLLFPVVALAAEGAADTDMEQRIDEFFGTWVVEPIAAVLFWEIPGIRMPFVVAWLVFGATYFTLRMVFPNIRLFRHALGLVTGRYDEPGYEGEVTHFQALASALSATVGLGNIAGVAIAIGTGGPGAMLWMMLGGVIGMSAKFTEVTLGQKYREVRSDGRMMGGAMFYLSKGLAELKLPRLGKGLAILFAILCIGGSFGGGNTFQVKQSLEQIEEVIPFFEGYSWLYGLMMVVLVGIVIIGGIRRIATVADKIVPVMCVLYVAAAIYILFVRAEAIPAAFHAIIDGALRPDAAYGGFLGVMVMGFKRSAFSNEAGIGSAAIAHSAAKVKYPVEEGIVALLEPFIDTVVVCTMTALVIIITGAYSDPANADLIAEDNGAALTSVAMGSVISWFPYLLSFAVVMFAYSTMLTWSYYGERCWAWLFGDRSSMVYRVIFLVFVFLGSQITASNILVFSDLMILGMALPNIAGVLLLSNGVKRDLDAYVGRLKSGEIKPTR
ncbi:MAG: alanine/glycine:cation symporter family protein [Myxococcota bacterium]